MTEEVRDVRARFFILEAVPTSDGRYQAEFRIHLDRALSRDDEVHFGGVHQNPLAALDESRAMARVYLATHPPRLPLAFRCGSA